jgi:hypothetical protein
MKAVVRTGDPVHILLTPDPSAALVGLLAGGVTVDIAEIIPGEANRWAKLPLYAGDMQILRSGTAQPLYGYCAADNFEGKLEPPAARRALIGFSVIYSRDAAQLAAKSGCRYFSVVGHVELASEIKDAYPDAVVLARPYVDTRGTLPTVDYVLSHLNGARDPRLIYLGLNEAEQVGQDPVGIRMRAQFDVEMATRIKSISGATYAAGSFSMGTPDITRGDVCDAMRQYYAPHYNSGLFWWDHHLYSPDMQHIYREDTQSPVWNGVPQTIMETEWYETRWHFLFTRCGFAPNSPSRIVCSETGVDQGGVGGFPAHNATNQDVLNWCKRFMQIASVPFSVGGASVPSPFIGGAIFQLGDPVNWAGYDMNRYLPSMASEFWLHSKVYIPVVTK